MERPNPHRLTVVGAAFGLALVGLAAGSAVAGGLLTPADGAATPSYATNDAGLTYGSLADAHSPETEPDLILVETVDGKTGYAYKKDLDEASGANVQSPEEAARWEPRTTEVPVYLADGSTRIGVFVVGGGTVSYDK